MGPDNVPEAGPRPKTYVRFGPLPTQEMPREWAEKMLTLWRQRSPAQFGKLLSEVVTSDQ
jgi:hypothetical protein